MNRRDTLRRLQRLEELTRRTAPTKAAAVELALDALTPQEVTQLARWAFRGDHSQPLPPDIARMLTTATGQPWQAGEVLA